LQRLIGMLALVGASLAATAGVRDADSPGPREAVSAGRVWVTTADGDERLASRGEVAFDGSPLPIDIALNPEVTAQRFSGAGASVTEASAHLLTSLFGSRGGTDFNAGDPYTFEAAA
jgi:glucosylceramidase